MEKLTLRNLGPIKEAELTFGDLTVLVGPQASGKSIAVQMLKLCEDRRAIHEQMTLYGLDWHQRWGEFFDAFLGEGMRHIWRESSAVQWNGADQTRESLAKKSGRGGAAERVFLVPAQRVLAIADGWPKPFQAFRSGDPFVVRDFSDKLRLLVEEFGEKAIFPQKNRLKAEFRSMIESALFGGFSLEVDTYKSQRRLVLREQGQEGLPAMVWSAGQREFVPLLLGLYWLMPAAKVTRRQDIEWVIVEEPEMGLHPRAIMTTMLMVLELLKRDYRVVLSTHSPIVLECVWLIRQLQEHGAVPDRILEAFGCKKTQGFREVAEAVMGKNMRVYSFGRDEKVRDISSLDPGAAELAESQWGGLAEFSERAGDAVASAVLDSGRRLK